MAVQTVDIMSTALSIVENKEETKIVNLPNWEKSAELKTVEQLGLTKELFHTVKNTYAKDFNDNEALMLLNIAKGYNLNLINGEVWGWKQGNKVSIMVGYKGYLKAGQSHPEYDGHIVGVVRENEIDGIEFDYNEGTVKGHKPNPFKGGKIVGAYCIAKKKGFTPFLSVVNIEEARKSDDASSAWSKSTQTMITKCAIAEAFKNQYGLVGLTMSSAENYEEFEKERPLGDDISPQPELLTTSDYLNEGSPMSQESVDDLYEPITKDQIQELKNKYGDEFNKFFLSKGCSKPTDMVYKDYLEGIAEPADDGAAVFEN